MAWNKTGTVTVTSASATVTGSGTAFSANVQVGEEFRLEGGQRGYEIVAVVSDTELTIAPAYLDTTQAGQDYVIVPVRGFAQAAHDALSSAIATIQSHISGALAGLFGAGSATAPGVAGTSDPDTGLFWPAANTLGIATGGTERARLSSSACQINVPITGTAVQSDAIDTTGGRLMKVGGFGLGASVPPAITDFTAELMPGLYRYDEATATGAPGSGAGWKGQAVVTRPHNDGRVVVLATRANPANPRHWVGVRNTSTGTITWSEIFHQASLLGTVSQASGVPTGAVIETGSNTNGRYTKFADGTMECSKRIDLGLLISDGSGSGTFADPYVTQQVTWTFPAAFVAAPVLSAMAEGGTTVGERNAMNVGCEAVSTTTATRIQGCRVSSNGNDDHIYAHVTARGRWFT